jgi:predicted transcriptional regulator of viral defense system
MDTATFLQTHRVFNLNEAVEALNLQDGKKSAVERLKYYVEKGRLKIVAREVYASIPPDMTPARFQPDRYLVATAARSDGIFSHHAALELLGAAHSDWNVCTILTSRRRPPIQLEGVTVRFLDHPKALLLAKTEKLGTRTVERLGRTLRVTGPERTLIDGFRQPALIGGAAELIESAGGFGVLDLDLLKKLLNLYHQKALWAAVGWFLERHQRTFFVPPAYLSKLEKSRPKVPQYLQRNQRRGVLVKRWNLIVPDNLVREMEPSEPQP